jgi:hypothetical protein
LACFISERGRLHSNKPNCVITGGTQAGFKLISVSPSVEHIHLVFAGFQNVKVDAFVLGCKAHIHVLIGPCTQYVTNFFIAINFALYHSTIHSLFEFHPFAAGGIVGHNHRHAEPLNVLILLTQI